MKINFVQKKLEKEEVFDLVNYFIERNNLDSSLLNKFINNNRIGMFNMFDGFFIPDLVDNDNFILIPEKRLDYYQVASTLAHELGHSCDYDSMMKEEREMYCYISPYQEVRSEGMQNKFNNFLIEDKISPTIGNYFNKSQLYTMYLYFNEAAYYFKNMDNKEILDSFKRENNINSGFDYKKLVDSVGYSIGFITAYYLDYYKEKEQNFYDIRKQCYDKQLLSEVGFSKEKVKKILNKELSKIKD